MAWPSNMHCQSVGSGTQSNAPTPVYIEEFFLSEAVRNEDPGELQLTFSSDSRRSLGSDLMLEIEYGLTKRVQFSSETAYGVTAGPYSEVQAGWSTTSLGIQYQVMRTESPFALSLGMAFGIPVRSREGLEFEPEVLAAKTFRRVQVHTSFVAEIEQDRPSFAYNVASVFLVSHRWFPTLEFNGRRLDDRNAFYLTAGLYRHFSNRVEIGAGIPVGVGGVAGPVGIVGKVTWELGGDKDEGVEN